MAKFSNLSRWFNLFGEFIMKFVNDEEIKEFSKKIEHDKLLSTREILKDTLDVIHFTVKCFLKHNVQGFENIEKDLTHELLIDSWQEIVFNAKSQVDKMNDDEIAKIAKHANCVQDAFNLVRMYMPVGMYQCSGQPIMYRELPSAGSVLGARKLRGYLRKVLDIYNILNTPAEKYNGASISIGYLSQTRLKEVLSGFSGAKGTSHCVSDFCGHEIYNTDLRHLHDAYLNEQPLDKVIGDPDVFLKWADENVKNINEYEFLKFLTRHESEITTYTRSKQSYPNLTDDEKDEICEFFCRWFLKEQAS